ncbi:traB domain-containing protein isoform 1 [Planoprotostelium fungivorum]|uniref:TraB domain-containing protein isoform 1 n=1 Tax=Planoprotostelium fungivorum TaxID=1890364 RepID=A0A2P6NYG3_9EUKA|nr:traB domain-containing protein isoform 1 [Planoprotostelium fungivorum]
MEAPEIVNLAQEEYGLDSVFVTQCTRVLVAPQTKATVYIVGTAHVSARSAEDVAKVIRIVRPDTIVLELCNNRAGLLLSNQNTAPQSDKEEPMTMTQVTDAIRQKGGLSGILFLLLSNMYKKIATKIKISPGIEFQRAYEEGRKIGSRIILGDRPIDITLRRSWAMLSFYEKTRFVWHLIKDSSLDISEDDIEKLKSHDIITEMLSEFTTEFPSLATTIIHERDQYLSGVLQSVPGRVVVAVVGLGHLRGIEKLWNQPLPNIESLLHVPRRESILWNTAKMLMISTGAVGIAYALLRYLRPK